MPTNFVNPYSGQEEETCSVSFAAQQEMGAHDPASKQTEAEFNKSKLLGEWGVIVAKLKKKEIPDGTKVLSYSSSNGVRGYFYVKGNKLHQKNYSANGKSYDVTSNNTHAENYIKTKYYDTTIPKVADKTLADDASEYKKNYEISPEYAEAVKRFGAANVSMNYVTKQPVVWTTMKSLGIGQPGKSFLVHGFLKKDYQFTGKNVTVIPGLDYPKNKSSLILQQDNGEKYDQQLFNTAKWWIELKPDDDGKTELTPKSPAKPKAELVPFTDQDVKDVVNGKKELPDNTPLAVLPNGDYVTYDKDGDMFDLYSKDINGNITVDSSPSFGAFVLPEEGWLKPGGTVTPKASAPPPVAAATPNTPVNAGSDSVGSMSNEDVSAMFVKVKDDLAKEQGLNIKGANPELDKLVFAKIGEATGYTGDEVKGKIDAYKAAGNKLSALKKKVLAGTKKVPTGKPQPTKATPAAPLTDPNQGSPKTMTQSAWKEIFSKAKDGEYSEGVKLLTFTTPKGDSGWVAISNGQPYTFILSPGKKPFKTKTQSLTIEGWIKSPAVDVKNVLANTPDKDPQPNGVPTVATPKLAEAVKAEVKAEVAKEPAKAYTDEDVAGAYIIAKDAIVASNTKGWTLYTKNDEFDLEIAIAVGLKTGLNPLQQKQAIANYLASGKKLSALKKQLAKQGAFTPKADSLKKSGADKSQEAKKADVEAKADAGYTPTPTPSSAVKPSADKPKLADFKDNGGVAAWKKAIDQWEKNQSQTGTAAKTDTGKELPKAAKSAAQESGDISGISDNVKKLYFDKFKSKGHQSYLSSSTGQNYEALVAVQKEMQLSGHSKDVTLLQVIRSVDEYGAKKAGVENGHLFEKKVVTWLSSSEGTRYIKDNEVKLAKQAEQAKAKAEAEKVAKLLEGKQPALPADSTLFQEMTPSKALGFQRVMLDKKPFGPGEKEGLRHYTGGAYTSMNNYMRGLSAHITPTDKRHIEKAKKGFRPAPEPMLLRRGTGANQFKSLGVGRGDTSLLWGITGKTFQDDGFVSTSAAGRSAFGGEVALEIETPAGAPVMWVDNFSKNPGENEMLLAPECKFKVLQVRKSGNTFVVRLRVVDWPGKA